MTARTIYTYLEGDSAAPRHLTQTDVMVMGLIVNLINNNNDIKQYKMYNKASVNGEIWAGLLFILH